MGVTPGDAAYPFLQAMLRMHEKAVRDLREIVGSTERAVLTTQQFDDIARRCAYSSQIATADHMRAHHWLDMRSMALAVLITAGLAGGAGIAAGYRFWGGAPTLTCGDQQGGRLCYYWMVQPTEAPKAAPPSDATPQQKLGKK